MSDKTCPKFYCINLESSADRKDRMIKRFELANITDYKFVAAADKNNSQVDYYTEGSNFVSDGYANHYFTIDQWRKDMACYASHFLAIKEFLKTDAVEAIICEDDILFNHKFMEMFNNIRPGLDPHYQILMLCYMTCSPFDNTIVNQTFKIPAHEHSPIWGAQCYLISRQYAEEVIKLYDLPLTKLRQYEGKITSEIILRRSKGYIAVTPLVIEDCISSVRAVQDCPYHLKHFCFWPWAEYAASDFSQESPLRHLSVEMAWPGYFTLFNLPYNSCNTNINLQLQEFNQLYYSNQK